MPTAFLTVQSFNIKAVVTEKVTDSKSKTIVLHTNVNKVNGPAQYSIIFRKSNNT